MGRARFLSLLIVLITSGMLQAQTGAPQYFYRIYLSDKGPQPPSSFAAEDMFTERALARRARHGITSTDIKDIPVYEPYLDKLSETGLRLHCTSRWMNTALFSSMIPLNQEEIAEYPFVSAVKLVKQPSAKGATSDKLKFTLSQADVPPYDRPVSMLNGYPLIKSGFNGRGVMIAVLDGGFTNADNISSLVRLRDDKRIRITRDFVGNDNYVYEASTHGTAVLSILAGNIEGWLLGTAQGADYLLLRTEDTASEYPCEEDFWAAGAEYADSCGADIISSSLGYSTFDSPEMDYKLSDLNGDNSFVTRAADIAASRGILVVNSAGNERNKAWKKIICPSDGDSVLAIGAVDGNNLISAFSSAGPSSDGRVKPDVSAMGVSVPLQVSGTGVSRGSGTSFSCPVLSGMAASLLQAVPEARNTDIIQAIKSSADRFMVPDSLYGFGIPDMTQALRLLQEKYVNAEEGEIIAAPNPTTGEFQVFFGTPPEKLIVEIVTLSGKSIYRRDYSEFAGRMLRVTELQYREQGVYLVRLITHDGSRVLKVIKLKY